MSASEKSNWETTRVVALARAMVRGRERGATVVNGAGFRQTGSGWTWVDGKRKRGMRQSEDGSLASWSRECTNWSRR